MADSYFTSVELLLHAEGTNGSTTFVDSSQSPKTVAVYGNAAISTTRSKFGSSSIALDGTGDVVGAQGMPSIAGDFTVEAWIYPNTSASQVIVRVGTSISVYIYSTALAVFADGAFRCATTAVPTNAWSHIAVVRSAGVLTTYLNGVATNTPANYSTALLSGEYSIGGVVGVGDYFNGYIDEFRVTAGVARYSANFTPPTEAFSDVPLIDDVIYATCPMATVSSYCGGYASLAAPAPSASAASGTVSTITAPSPTFSSQAYDSTGWQAAYLTAPSPTLTFFTGAVARDLKAPKPTLTSAGSVEGWATADLTAPSPTLAASGTVSAMASFDLTFGYVNGHNYELQAYSGALVTAASPAPSVSASGTVGIVARVAVRAPVGILAAHSGASARLTSPAPRLSAHAFKDGSAQITLTAPTPAVAAFSGPQAALSCPSPMLVASGYECSARANLTAPSATLVGYGGAVVSVTVGGATVSATGTTGGVASIAVRCPLFELTASATAQNHGSINVLAPSPRLGAQAQAWLMPPSAKLTAIGSAVVTATYEAYAVNLGHRPRVTNQEMPIDEVTRYTNFPFTHVVRYRNSYYGANSTGLYLLEGTTDDGTAIPWAVKTAMDDFKTPLKKTVASVYFGGRLGPASTVQLHAGEQAPNTYSFSTPRDTLAQNHRQVFGKGVKERYYALGASGTGELELDTVELETHNMTRRI